MFPPMTENEIRQNLIDAGCDERLIQSYMTAMKANACHKCLRLLERRRCALLDEIHAAEKRLSCLDYLRYQLRKSQH